VNNRRALTKFLLAVEWTVESEVVQAAELLEQWRERSPIEVTDALKLLGKNVAFQTGLVRSYAIDTLAAAPDGELVLYLLQLVQALKYENLSNNNNIGNDGPVRQKSVGKPPGGGGGGFPSLGAFLIERAVKNIELANYLYWYLKVELDDPIHGPRYRAVFKLFQERASRSYATSTPPPTTTTPTQTRHTPSHLHRTPSRTPSVWDILTTQDSFLTGVTDCQAKSGYGPRW